EKGETQAAVDVTVVLVAGNTPEFVIGLYGALRAGAIVAPVNPRSARPELEHFLADTEARMLLVDPTVGEGVQALAAADSGPAQLLALGALD
ncbi:AMP-binding protein, partial [Planococcus sp. SIMBA_143]